MNDSEQERVSECVCVCGLRLNSIKLYNLVLLNLICVFKPAHSHNYKRVRQWPGRSAFNPRSKHTKDSKNGICCLLA